MIGPNDKKITNLDEFLVDEEDLELYEDESFINALANEEYDEDDEEIQILNDFGYIQ